jgi:hypothetical protein
MRREEASLLDLPETRGPIVQHHEKRPAFVTQIQALVRLSGNTARPAVRHDRVLHFVGELSLYGYNV